MELAQLELYETKQYKAVEKESGKEYAREFTKKTESELKEAIFVYMEDKAKLTEEMNANQGYSAAKAYIDEQKAGITEDLKPLKVSSDLALEVIERKSEQYDNTNEDKDVRDIKQAKAVSTLHGESKVLEIVDKLSTDELKQLVCNYYTMKKHLELEMTSQDQYKDRDETVKTFQSALRDQLKPQKCCYELALELLKRLKASKKSEK